MRRSEPPGWSQSTHTRRRASVISTRDGYVFGFRLSSLCDDAGSLATGAPEELWAAFHRPELAVSFRWIVIPASVIGPPGHVEVVALTRYHGSPLPASLADEIVTLLALAFPRSRFEPIESDADLRFVLAPFAGNGWCCELVPGAGSGAVRTVGFERPTGAPSATAVSPCVTVPTQGNGGRALLLLASWSAASFLEWALVPVWPAAGERDRLLSSVREKGQPGLSHEPLFFESAVCWHGAAGAAPVLLGASLARSLGIEGGVVRATNGQSSWLPIRELFARQPEQAHCPGFLFMHAAMPAMIPPPVALCSVAPSLVSSVRSRAPEGLLPEEGTLLGLTEDGRSVRLPDRDALQHCWCIGQSGVGKTSLIAARVLETIEAGDVGVAVFDPHGDLVEAIEKRIPASRREDLLTVDVGEDPAKQPTLNLLEAHSVAEVHMRAGQVLELISSLWPKEMCGPMFQQASMNALLLLGACMEEPGTISDLPRVFLDTAYRKQLLAAHGVEERVPEAVRWWTQGYANYSDFTKSESVDYYISKFGLFAADPVLRAVVGRTRSTLDLRGLMDHGGVLLCSLGRSGVNPIATSLLIGVFMHGAFNAALSRADMLPEERRHFHVYADEFQRIAGPSTGAMLSEIRKYGVGLFIANQYVDQLPGETLAAILGNVGTKIIFRVGARDALRITEYQPSVSVEELVRLPNFTALAEVLVNGVPSAPFTLFTPGPLYGASPVRTRREGACS